MKRITIAIGITLLFLGMSISLSVEINNYKKYLPISSGNTLYVGGSGPGNYSKIQDAINDASNGDTVFVYNGTYYEHVYIDISITLQGENKNSTFIDGNRTDGDTINVIADYVTITGFTIQHSGKQKGDSGIKLNSNNNTIEDNIIRENGWILYYYKQGGLHINEGSHNTINNNTIINNRDTGIYLHHCNNNDIRYNAIHDNSALAIISNASSYNMIVKNEVYENFCGMTFWPYSTHNIIEENHIHDHPGCGSAFKMHSNHNIIRNNKFINNLEWSIMLGFGPTKHNIVEYNLISGTTGGQQNWFDGSGIVLSIAFFNKIRFNNFIGNKNDVYLENSLFNHWKKNYWDSHNGFGVKIIKGHFAKRYIYHPEKKIPYINIDWRPEKNRI